MGVDVGGRRKGFDVAIIDKRRLVELHGHLSAEDVVSLIERCSPAVTAIDSPCGFAPEGETSREGERKLARAICGIRWTPDETRAQGPYYEWVHEGLALHRMLEAHDETEVIEVFPTASWTRWLGSRAKRTRAAWTTQGLATLDLAGLPLRSNQDQRDAIAAALTARLHSECRTERLGDLVVPALSSVRACRPR